MIASWFAAMAVLVACSAFFSMSEAALFSLRRSQRRWLAKGSRSQRAAAALLAEPDRLLTAILFGNLLANLAYFTLAAILGLRWEHDHRATAAAALAAGALLTLIVFGEMLPKSLALLRPRRLAALVALPLAGMVRLLDPLLPVFRTAILLSRRLVWPRFQAEPYLRVRDLERAVQLSASDAALVEQEQRVLESIVLMSEIRAEELMRPRNQVLSFRPPVRLEDVKVRAPSSGFLLVTEPESDEVAAAVALEELSSIPDDRLDVLAEPVSYIPWCTTVAAALELLQRQGRRVAAVVNEFGETIGILTLDDILDTIFSGTPSRSERFLRRPPIRRAGQGVWQVTAMTSLRRLARYFDLELPESKSVTVAGVIQEVLERLPQTGDECRWGPFRLKVLDVPRRGQLLVQLTLAPAEEVQP